MDEFSGPQLSTILWAAGEVSAQAGRFAYWFFAGNKGIYSLYTVSPILYILVFRTRNQ